MKAIAAVDKNLAIGNKGKLLFSLPGDLAHFKAATIGGVVIMGRKTLESIPGGRPLPGRHTMVLSRTMEKGFTEITKGDKRRVLGVFNGVGELLHFLESGDEVDLSFTYEEPMISEFAGMKPLKSASSSPLGNVSVCGGEEIYRLLLPYCDELVLTEVQAEAPEADAWFPDFRKSGEWAEASRTEPVEENGLTYTICTYKRIPK